MAKPPPKLERAKTDSNTYYVANETWSVGPRYELIKYLGAGSFSRVCAARDNATGAVVALKRISNVGRNLDHTRIVLRELCILRRLSHPNIVNLLDAFWKPSPTGRMVLVDGELTSTTIDVYLAMECCPGGDLHALRGQLTAAQVQSLMRQLTEAVSYLHSLKVWHRDVKSANVLLKVHRGQQVAKLADFGSARSGGMRRSARREPLMECPAGVSMLPLVEQLKLASGPDAGRLTTTVCTPCYRAPEVVISRGRYNAAMDMWSLGCVFGELLQRVERTGASFTPQLTINPVFQLSAAELATPSPSARFMADSTSLAKRELQAIFDVIGTPEWACIDAVEDPRWRHYLSKLPARAPHLFRRFGAAGETAVDLLRRLLAFDPKRRSSSREALSHEFFAMEQNRGLSGVPEEGDEAAQGSEQATSTSTSAGGLHAAAAVPVPEATLMDCDDGIDATPAGMTGRLQEGNRQSSGGATDASATLHHSLSGLRLDRRAVRRQATHEPARPSPDQKRLRAETSATGDGAKAGYTHYADIVEPAAALQALELEIDRLLPADADAESKPGDCATSHGACQILCKLIKAECEAEAVRQAELRMSQLGAESQTPSQALTADEAEDASAGAIAFRQKWWGARTPLERDPRHSARSAASLGAGTLASAVAAGERTPSLDSLQLEDPPLQVFGPSQYCESTSPRRPYTARRGSESGQDGGPPGSGTAFGKGGAEEQLKPGRHQEWSLTSGRELAEQTGPAWGGGMLDMQVDEATRAIIGRQQAR